MQDGGGVRIKVGYVLHIQAKNIMYPKQSWEIGMRLQRRKRRASSPDCYLVFMLAVVQRMCEVFEHFQVARYFVESLTMTILPAFLLKENIECSTSWFRTQLFAR